MNQQYIVYLSCLCSEILQGVLGFWGRQLHTTASLGRLLPGRDLQHRNGGQLYDARRRLRGRRHLLLAQSLRRPLWRLLFQQRHLRRGHAKHLRGWGWRFPGRRIHLRGGGVSYPAHALRRRAAGTGPGDAGRAARSGAVATYNITMKEFQQQLHSELPPTTVWGYDDGTGPSTPGRSIEASTGQPVTVNWTNDMRDFDTGLLRTSHYLQQSADDLSCIHGAENEAKTVVHLHGGHVPAAVDGYPEDTFLPGARR